MTGLTSDDLRPVAQAAFEGRELVSVERLRGGQQEVDQALAELA